MPIPTSQISLILFSLVLTACGSAAFTGKAKKSGYSSNGEPAAQPAPVIVYGKGEKGEEQIDPAEGDESQNEDSKGDVSQNEDDTDTGARCGILPQGGEVKFILSVLGPPKLTVTKPTHVIVLGGIVDLAIDVTGNVEKLCITGVSAASSYDIKVNGALKAMRFAAISELDNFKVEVLKDAKVDAFEFTLISVGSRLAISGEGMYKCPGVDGLAFGLEIDCMDSP